MPLVHTAFGEGQIVGEETVRGRKQYLVAGNGFKLWIDESDAQIHTGAADFDFEPAEDVNEENSTDLPYNPEPQFPVEGFQDEQTIQPNHELDADERLSPADSLTFDEVDDREYPGPGEHLFARRTAAGRPPWIDDYGDPIYVPEDEPNPWLERYNEEKREEDDRRFNETFHTHPTRTTSEKFAGLSDKYIDITADVDHYNDPVVRFRDDPIREINRLAYSLSDVHDDDRMEHYAALVDSDPMLRESAWSDVRQKAQRIRREGKLDIHDIDNNQIYATVHGDHGDYDVMIVKGGLGGQSITQWTCTCDWGRHAFKRKVLHVGRLCSHGLAGWLEMQSHELSDVAKKHPYKKRADIIDDYKSYNDENNDGHVDKATADNFISRPHQTGGIEPLEPEDVDKLYNYVEDNKTQPGRRNYEVPYTLDPDKVYKSAAVGCPECETIYNDDDELERHWWSRHHNLGEGPDWDLADEIARRHGSRYADVLRTSPHSLTPDMRFIPKGEDSHFVDVEEDERETTGPDQIVHFSSRTAGYEDDIDGGWDRYVTERTSPRKIVPGGPHEFSSTGAAYDECMSNDQIKSGDIIHIPNEGVVGIAGTWPAAVTKQIGQLHAFNDEIHANPDLVGRDGAGEWTGDHIRRAIEFARQHGYETGPYVKESRLRYAGEEVEPEPYRDFDGGGELLDELREESSTPLEEDFGNMRDRNDDVREIVEELREKGYDADQFVASRRRQAAEWRRTVCAHPGCDQDIEGDVDGDGSDGFMDRGGNYHGSDGHKHFPEEWSVRYMEGRQASYGVGNQGAGPGGAFGQPGGGNWADHPFAGSGPDPKFWYESSEDYVDAHERPRYEDVTDLGDDDIIKYTKDKPKQSKTAWMPGKHKRQKDRPLLPENYEEEDDAGRGITRLPSGEQAETLVVRRHHGSVDAEDPIENFYKSGAAEAIKSGGMSSGGGSFSDDAIAERANQFLMRTAGRNYSLAEQRELEDEEHHLGARNLDGLDLAGTHYISDL